MSISSEIDRINTNVANTYSALEGAGADMPAQQNTDNLPETVLTIKAVRYDAQTLTDAQQSQARTNIAALGESDVSLGIASDGLIYLFIKGVPVGTGIPQGQSGDVFGYVDENNTVVLTGNLADGSYTIKYAMEDGTTKEIGDLTLGEEIQVSYIQCAYIENSDKDSYVDLGIVNTESTGIQIKFEYATVSAAITGSIGGLGIMGNGDIAIGNATYAGGDLRAYWGGVKSYQLKEYTYENTEYTAGMNYLNSGKGSIDGTDKNMNSGTKTLAKNETIMLCRQNGNKNFKNNGLIRVKEVYISEGTSVAKHYVPAYRSTDGAIGMLETNSNEFITATGTFTKGADTGNSYDGSGGDIPAPDAPETPDIPSTGYINKIPLSTDASGNPYNNGQGWKTGYRLSGSSGNESAQEGTEVTGFIPVKYGDTVYLKDITDDGTHVICFYKSDYSFLAASAHNTAFGGAIGGEIVSFVVNGNLHSSMVSESGIAFMRVSATEITADSIITVNEPIE